MKEMMVHHQKGQTGRAYAFAGAAGRQTAGHSLPPRWGRGMRAETRPEPRTRDLNLSMKADHKPWPARFIPAARFEIRPLAAAPFRSEEEHPLESLKRRLLAERLGEVWDPGLNSLVRRAANDAAAIAWTSPFPLLVFPVLFEEKIEAGATQAARQSLIWARSRELVAV